MITHSRGAASWRVVERWPVVLVVLATAGAPVLCVAGENNSATSSEQLSTIVVTAQKRAEDVQSVPITVQAFTGEELGAKGLKWTSDLNQMLTNAQILLPNGSGNQPVVAIRGISVNDFNTSNAGPNAMYADGIYLSSPASQTFQMFDLDRVEVLKGPQGTLYGMNASGGAINFISAQPTSDFTGNLDVDYGSYNAVQVEGAASGPLSPQLLARVAVNVNHSDGYVYNQFTGNHENGGNDQAARVTLLYLGVDDLKLTFNLHGGRVDNRPAEYRSLGSFVPGTESSASPTVCPVTEVLAAECVDVFGYRSPARYLSGAYNRQEPLRITSGGGFIHADYARGPVTYTFISAFDHNRKTHPEDSDASPYRNFEVNFGVENSTFTSELRASQTEARFNWVTGIYYLHERLRQDQGYAFLLDFDQHGAFGVPAGAGAGNGIAFQFANNSAQVTDAYAAFGQGQYYITDRLEGVLGVRYSVEERSHDYESDTRTQECGENCFGPAVPTTPISNSLRDSKTTWRAGLNYHFSPDVMAYVSAATGFKSGIFNGGFLSGTTAELERYLQPVGPEHITAYEVGFKSSYLNHRLLIDLAAFYNDYRDMQIYSLVATPVGPLNVLDNAKKAHTQGLDLQLAAKPWVGVTASISLGWLATRLDSYVSDRATDQIDYTGNQLPFAPHVSGTFTIGYKHPVGSASAEFEYDASYKDQQFYDNANDPYIAQKAYWLQNVRLAYETEHHWGFAVYVRNLANQHYAVGGFDGTEPFGFVQYVYGTPRSYGARVSYHY